MRDTGWMSGGDDDTFPVVRDPSDIIVLMAGGPGKHTLLVPSWGMTRSVTLPVEG